MFKVGQKRVDDYEAYETYMALKLHFKEGSYNYFKYHGKVGSTSIAKFNKHKQRYQFHKLSKKKDPIGFLVANFVTHGDIWLGTMLEQDEYQQTYLNWKGKQASIVHLFGEEVSLLAGHFKKSISIKGNGHPLLLRMIMREDISFETAIIIDSLTNCFSYWDDKMKDDIIWNEVKRELLTYKPFIKFDEEECKRKLLAKLTQ